MSFDDVARRMKTRHAEGMVPRLEAPSPLPQAPPDADAVTRSMIDSQRRAAKQRSLLVGGILFGVGLFITIATYDSASESGGTYVIAYGPMVAGVIQVFRGLAG